MNTTTAVIFFPSFRNERFFLLIQLSFCLTTHIDLQHADQGLLETKANR